jgi:hypothetical protein
MRYNQLKGMSVVIASGTFYGRSKVDEALRGLPGSRRAATIFGA